MSKIKFVNYPNYIRKETEKRQIVLHHTVSYGSAWNVIRYWKGLRYKVGTHFIIDREGNIFQLFNTKYWSGHVGKVKEERKMLGVEYEESPSKNSIGIELISAGGLINAGHGLYINAYGRQHNGEVIELENKFRGYKFFEPYTGKQLDSLHWLLEILKDKWDIKVTVDKVEDIFKINKKALSGERGIFAHVSYRRDKSDIFPQKEMVELLKTFV